MRSFLLFGATLLSAACTAPPSVNNRPAPAFDLPNVHGGRVSLESLKGKVVVLDFWATWCGPCIVEIPHYAELWRKNNGRGVEIIGVACESDPQEVINTIVTYQIPYRQLLNDDRVAAAYGASGLPTTYVIDKHGSIRGTFVGTTPSKFENLQRTIDELLAAP